MTKKKNLFKIAFCQSWKPTLPITNSRKSSLCSAENAWKFGACEVCDTGKECQFRRRNHPKGSSYIISRSAKKSSHSSRRGLEMETASSCYPSWRIDQHRSGEECTSILYKGCLFMFFICCLCCCNRDIWFCKFFFASSRVQSCPTRKNQQFVN